MCEPAGALAGIKDHPAKNRGVRLRELEGSKFRRFWHAIPREPNLGTLPNLYRGGRYL